MKKGLLFIILFVGISLSYAQSNLYVNPKVTVNKSNCDISFILNAHYDKNVNCDKEQGYRIQIVNSSNRDEVYNKKTDVYQNFNNHKAYIVYDLPYYKLRVGDFKTKLEARKLLEEIIAIFPTAFIVKDEIIVK